MGSAWGPAVRTCRREERGEVTLSQPAEERGEDPRAHRLQILKEEQEVVLREEVNARRHAEQREHRETRLPSELRRIEPLAARRRGGGGRR